MPPGAFKRQGAKLFWSIRIGDGYFCSVRSRDTPADINYKKITAFDKWYYYTIFHDNNFQFLADFFAKFNADSFMSR